MTHYLLDTHAALWWWRDVGRLSDAATAAIKSAENVSVSAISALEIAIKWRLGKLDMIGDPEIHYPRLMRDNGFAAIAVKPEHAMLAGLLPGEHRDPFDRVIAAQAMVEGATVVTRDPAFAGFACSVLW